MIKRFNPFSRHDWEHRHGDNESRRRWHAEQVGDAFKDTAAKRRKMAEEYVDPKIGRLPECPECGKEFAGRDMQRHLLLAHRRSHR